MKKYNNMRERMKEERKKRNRYMIIKEENLVNEEKRKIEMKIRRERKK